MPESMMDKVAALLAKAESTTNEAEAEAFLAGAQRIATTHQIDIALAAQRSQRARRRERLVERTIQIGLYNERNKQERIRLMSAVAHANDVKLNISGRNQMVFLFGFESDIEVVDAFYSSLLVQMEAALQEAFRQGRHREPENLYFSPTSYTMRSDKRIYRRSFYKGYIARVAQRLQNDRRSAISEAQTSHDTDDAKEDSSSVALVLKSKQKQVEDFYSANSTARGTWKPTKAVASVAGAARDGQKAGDKAQMKGTRTLEGRKEVQGGN